MFSMTNVLQEEYFLTHKHVLRKVFTFCIYRQNSQPSTCTYLDILLKLKQAAFEIVLVYFLKPVEVALEVDARERESLHPPLHFQVNFPDTLQNDQKPGTFCQAHDVRNSASYPSLKKKKRGTVLLFFMLMKSAISFYLHSLTHIICPSETPFDANLCLPFATIQFFNSKCYLKGGYAIQKCWTIIEDIVMDTSHNMGARYATEKNWIISWRWCECC